MTTNAKTQDPSKGTINSLGIYTNVSKALDLDTQIDVITGMDFPERDTLLSSLKAERAEIESALNWRQMNELTRRRGGRS